MIRIVTGFISVLLLSSAEDSDEEGVLPGSWEEPLPASPFPPQEARSSRDAKIALRVRADLPMFLYMGKPP